MLAQNDVKKALLDQKFSMLDNFVKETRLDQSLKFEMQIEIRKKIDRAVYSTALKEELFQDLSSNLKYEIADKIYGGVLKHFSFFANQDKVFISNIFPLLEPQIFISKEIVYNHKELANNIYFLAKGRVHFISTDLKKPFKVLNVGCYFGDIEVIKKIRREFSVISPNESFILTMGNRIICKIKEEFPSV